MTATTNIEIENSSATHPLNLYSQALNRAPDDGIISRSSFNLFAALRKGRGRRAFSVIAPVLPKVVARMLCLFIQRRLRRALHFSLAFQLLNFI
jgi:hypothetical protein